MNVSSKTYVEYFTKPIFAMLGAVLSELSLSRYSPTKYGCRKAVRVSAKDVSPGVLLNESNINPKKKAQSTDTQCC